MVTVEERQDRDGLLTEDEAALYDRQLRLWGVDAQRRLVSSKILIIGLGGLGAELAKNIILGGVKSVTLMDPAVVSELDAASQFLVSRESIGKNRAEASVVNAQKLNPMVKVEADPANPDDKLDSYFEGFNVIVATNCTKKQILRLNKVARLHNVKFFAGDVFGFTSYMFSDLGEHQYRKEIVSIATKTAPESVKVIEGVSRFTPFEDLLKLDWSSEQFSRRVKRTNSAFFSLFVLLDFIEEHNRRPDPSQRDADYQDLLNRRDAYVEDHGIPKEKVPDELFVNVFGDIAPVCAITGGVVSQEVVKAVSHKDVPLVNLFVYNPVDGTGYVENLAG
jgi:molybdopterin/thiamine biosynthesis adenylyltransferase